MVGDKEAEAKAGAEAADLEVRHSVTVFLQQLVAAKENSAAGGQTNGLTC